MTSLMTSNGLKALGDYLVVPNDNASWCEFDRCREILATSTQDKRDQSQFSNARNSYYIFQFINEVAKEVRNIHPDKFITELAYASSAYPPKISTGTEYHSVAPCLQVYYGYNAPVFENDEEIYRLWLEDTDRPFFLWNFFITQ